MTAELILAIISNLIALVALWVSVWTATKSVERRTQRDFFINEYKILNEEYRDFIRLIRSDGLSAEAIRDGFHHFYVRINTIDGLCCREYEIEDDSLVVTHGDLYDTTTELESVNDQYSHPVVKLTAIEKSLIDNQYQLVDKSFLQRIILVNKAKRS